MTKQAILDAARQLFSEKGYFSTKVDEIAARARVAPATLYAVSGGKSGLLRSLVDFWSTAPVVASTIDTIEKMDDAVAIVQLVAAINRSMREDCGDVIRVLLATAPHDKGVAKSLAVATSRYRAAFVPIARRLLDLGALRQELSVEECADIFWFYFGYSALFTLHDDNGWSYERAEKWLSHQAQQALLRKPKPDEGRK